MTSIRDIQPGLTFTASELHEQIKATGWELRKVKHDRKTDRFIATAKNEHGEELEAWGKTEKLALSALLVKCSHRNHMRSSKLSMWTHTFTDQLPQIAEAYSKAPLYEPKAAAAFLELGRDSVRRAETLAHHLEITIVNEPEPYKQPEKMFDDIRKRRKLLVSRAGIDHPVWSEEEHIAYRIVHDVLGHAASGGGFDWQGENLAFAAHAAIISAEAQKALFTESIGHTAYAAYYRAYGPRKIALFPKFLDKVQEKFNPHKQHPGLHPSQSRPPAEVPHIKPLAAVALPSKESYDLTPDQSQTPLGSLVDPNDGWQSGVQPLEPQQLSDGRTVGNALLHHGDPLDLTGGTDAQGNPTSPLKDNAQLIEREWALFNQEDPAQLATMKLAISNAFRVVLLSPKKDLRWNAAHYQDISHIPADEDDPYQYYDALENKRQEFNVANGFDRYSHLPYREEAQALTNVLYSKNPQGIFEYDGRTYQGYDAAKKQADIMIFQMKARIMDKLEAQDAHLPEDKQRDHLKLEAEANKEMSIWLKTQYQPTLEGMDHQAALTPEKADALGQGSLGFDVDQVIPRSVNEKYGAFMHGQLRACALIGEHVDEILKAALYDVHERNGEGWHFRSVVLHLNIPGVGPKVCSFAWLLLSPMTSELATIDTHMMALLGQKRGTAPSPRDYFKLERQFRAGMDAAGYNGVPLGMLQWGAWDAARTGLGTHQDHSPLAVLNPANWRDVDWHAKAQNTSGLAPIGPDTDWWKATEPARQAAGDDFDATLGHKVPQNQIPYQNLTPEGTLSKVATSHLTPWFTHPDTAKRVVGLPGQTIIQHATDTLGLSVPEAWQRIAEAGKASPTYKRADLYHVAPTVDRERIRQHGLQPSSPYHNWATPEDWQRVHGDDFVPPEGVYGWPYTDDADQYKRKLDRHRQQPHDIWRIPRSEIQQIETDPDAHGAEYVPHPVFNPILEDPTEDQPWPTEVEPPFWREVPVTEERRQLGIGLPDRIIGKRH